MKGWKTLTGAVIMIVGAVLRLKGMGELADTVIILGAALTGVGVGHKGDKAKAAVEEIKAAIKQEGKPDPADTAHRH